MQNGKAKVGKKLSQGALLKKKVSSMDRKDLEQVALGLVRALYFEGGRCNPDKEWDSDTFDEICAVAQAADLIPPFDENVKGAIESTIPKQ